MPGPQTTAYTSQADIIFYGGAAGGGKTDLALGSSLTRHTRSLILRREFPQLESMIERSKEIFNEYGHYNEKGRWRCHFAGRQQLIRFGSVQHEKDLSKYKGRPNDLLVIDEAAEFPQSFVSFLTTWLRSENAGQPCQLLLCSNPPTDPEGDWLVVWFGPWIDPNHPNPAKSGEIRWFIVIGRGEQEEHIEVSGPEHVWKDGKEYTPQSRTFIQAKVSDNPYYANTPYVARLQALPEPLRSKMLEGDFSAGREDNAFQVIPSDWVRMANARWEGRSKPATPQTTVGVDVARGGMAKTVLTLRYDNWFDKQISVPGIATPNGATVAALVIQHRQTGAKVNIDIGGVGASPYDALAAILGRDCTPMNGAEKSEARDKSGKLSFVNLRAEWWWKLRESLSPESGDELAIPPDAELLSDLTTPRWKLTVRGIQIEEKTDIIERIHRSPDKGDSLVYAHAIKYEAYEGLLGFHEKRMAENVEEEKRRANNPFGWYFGS